MREDLTNEMAIEVLMWALNRLDGHNYIVDGYGTVDIRAKVDAFGMAIESLRHGSRHGRWIAESRIKYNGKYINIGDTMPMDDGVPAGFCSCSECKECLTASDEYAVFGYYCPKCGAKMNMDGDI